MKTLTSEVVMMFGVHYNGSNNFLYYDFRTSNGIVFQDNGTTTIVLEDSGVIRPNADSTGALGTTSAY